MDYEFIRRAERVTSFNLVAADFKELTHKKEIQMLFGKYFFPNFDLSQTLDTVDQDRINQLVDQLRRQDKEMLSRLISYPLKGIGPGEIMMYFLVNRATIGGGSSAGVDLFVDDSKYEVKAASVSKDRFATNFKLGAAVPVAALMKELYEMLHNMRTNRPELTSELEGTRTGISGGTVNRMRELGGSAFSDLEDAYAELAYTHYFSHHPTIIINNKAVNRVGLIEDIKYIQKSDIQIERLTAGTLKPRIRL